MQIGRNASALVALMLTIGAGAAVAATTLSANADPEVQRVEVQATVRGFVPNTIELQAGVPTELVVTRTTASGCAAQIHIPELGVEKVALPMNEAVTIAFTPKASGDYAFLCGMNMFRGTVVVRQR